MDKLLTVVALAIVHLMAFVPNSIKAEEAPAQPPIVQAILFYSPTCPHCHQVINDFLLPLQENYGDQLQVIGIDTSHPVGSELYGSAIEWFDIPQTRHGVPMLIVGEKVLVGGDEIPREFPALVEEGLAAGGMGWPLIPNLAMAIPDLPPSAEPVAMPEVFAPPATEPASEQEIPSPIVTEPEQVATSEETSDIGDEETVGLTTSEAETIKAVSDLDDVDTEAMLLETESPPADPVGFATAAIVLFGMIVALIYCLWLIGTRLQGSIRLPVHSDVLPWTIPFLAMLGLGVSLYLSYVEVAQVRAVCGPIGECNIVQTSEYAQLIGIPIAVLGALTYVSIIVLWAGTRCLPLNKNSYAFTGLVALTIFCTVFSLYLTVLEIFVISAVCAWCLTSAVISTLLMILTAAAVKKNQPEMRWEAQYRQS